MLLISLAVIVINRANSFSLTYEGLSKQPFTAEFKSNDIPAIGKLDKQVRPVTNPSAGNKQCHR